MKQSEFIQVLGSFFADVRGICGTEGTFHAALYHQLIKYGVRPLDMARSLRFGGETLDLAIFDDTEGGRNVATIIEFKGGAQGKRNALKGYVQAGKPIKALRKIVDCGAANVSGWLVFIDLPELGTALNEAMCLDAAERAARQGIGFAYYNASRKEFLVCEPNENCREVPIALNENAGNTTRSAPNHFSIHDAMRTLASTSVQMAGAEDNYACQLYSALRLQGLGSEQVALETYFNLASIDGSRMQLRPDLTIFDSGVKGRFNLYRNGDINLSNDRIKLQNLRTLVEIKGGAALDNSGEKKVAQAYLADIQKLIDWRALVNSAFIAHDVELAAASTYVFLGIDNRAEPLSSEALTAVQQKSREAGVDMYYVHRGNLEASPITSL